MESHVRSYFNDIGLWVEVKLHYGPNVKAAHREMARQVAKWNEVLVMTRPDWCPAVKGVG